MRKKSLDKGLIRKYGSPLFVLDKEKLVSNFEKINTEFNKLFPTIVAYSYKTNYLPFICHSLHKVGAYAEVIPGFEFEIAKKIKVPGEKIIVNGPYKPECELISIIQYGCKINVDNIFELRDIIGIANKFNITIEIGLRVNINVGSKIIWNKFGFNLENGEAQQIVDFISKLNNIKIIGLHTHIGTNITDVALYSKATNHIVDFYLKNVDKIDLKYLDIGGGFCTEMNGLETLGYQSKTKFPCIKDYAHAICNIIIDKLGKSKEIVLIIEPGRAIIDDAMCLLTTITAIKNIFDVHSIFIDAGVNIIPSSYYRKHSIELISDSKEKPIITDIYGPLCMQVDLIDSGIYLPKATVGNILKIGTCGAYELSHSIQFIRTRPAVVAIEKSGIDLIRRKENPEDVISLDNWELLQ